MAIEPTGRFEHPIGRAGTDRHHVVVEPTNAPRRCPERQSAVAFQRMTVVEVQDRLLLPVLKPPVPRDLSVVLVDHAVPGTPLVELAAGQPHPAQQLPGRQLRALGPMTYVVDDLVPRVVGNPASCQSSPLAFFARTFSSISSAITSFFCTSFCSSWAIL